MRRSKTPARGPVSTHGDDSLQGKENNPAR